MTLPVKSASFLVLAVLVASPAAALGEKKVKDPNEVICKTEAYVGSHVSRRLCMTRSEWDSVRYQSKKVLDDNNGKLRYEVPKTPGG